MLEKLHFAVGVLCCLITSSLRGRTRYLIRPYQALSYLGLLEIANKNFPLKLMILKGAELPKPPQIFSGRKKTDKATIRKRGCRYRERSVALFNPPPSCVETKPPAYLSVYRGRRACFRRRRIAGERMAKKRQMLPQCWRRLTGMWNLNYWDIWTRTLLG